MCYLTLFRVIALGLNLIMGLMALRHYVSKQLTFKSLFLTIIRVTKLINSKIPIPFPMRIINRIAYII